MIINENEQGPFWVFFSFNLVQRFAGLTEAYSETFQTSKMEALNNEAVKHGYKPRTIFINHSIVNVS